MAFGDNQAGLVGVSLSPSADEAAGLVGRVGRLMLINGADTTHALVRMQECAGFIQQPIFPLVTAESIAISVGEGAALRTRVGPLIPAMAVNVGALIAIERALDAWSLRTADVSALQRRLDEIERHPPVQSPMLVIVGLAIAAASLARLFGAPGPVMAAAFLAGLVSAVLRQFFAARHTASLAAAFLTALLSGAVAEAGLHVLSTASPVLCLTAAGMILVPGVPLINGMRDLLQGHAGIAMARLTLATTTVLTVGFALLLVSILAGTPIQVDDGPGRVTLPEDLLYSGMAAAGYAMLFSVPFRVVPACMLCGVVGHSLRSLLLSRGLDLAASSLLGSAAVGVVASVAAHRYRMPPVAFAFPGVVAMIPGSYGFRAAIGGLQLMNSGASAPLSLLARSASLAITTALTTVAIATGLCLALALLPIIYPAASRSPQRN